MAMLMPMITSCGGGNETSEAATTSLTEGTTTEASETKTESATKESQQIESNEPSATEKIEGSSSEIENGSESESDLTTETKSSDITETTETESMTESVEESVEETEDETKEDIRVETSLLDDIENGPSIEYAQSILNGVNYYYPNYKRESAILENMEMSLTYNLSETGNKQVTSLTNKKGVSYVENTMDVFVRMTDGNTYFASTSTAAVTSNLFRLGYYFYEARYEEQDFLNSVKIAEKTAINIADGCSKHNNTESSVNENGELCVNILSASDPYIVIGDGSHKGDPTSLRSLLRLTLPSITVSSI